MSARENWLQIRMTEKEREVVDEIAEYYGLDASNLVRQAINYVRVARPQIQAFRLLTEEEEREDSGDVKWLRVRMDEWERQDVDVLAYDYGLDNSKFLRLVMSYLRTVKPNPIVIPEALGKGVALHAE